MNNIFQITCLTQINPSQLLVWPWRCLAVPTSPYKIYLPQAWVPSDTVPCAVSVPCGYLGEVGSQVDTLLSSTTSSSTQVSYLVYCSGVRHVTGLYTGETVCTTMRSLGLMAQPTSRKWLFGRWSWTWACWWLYGLPVPVWIKSRALFIELSTATLIFSRYTTHLCWMSICIW